MSLLTSHAVSFSDTASHAVSCSDTASHTVSCSPDTARHAVSFVGDTYSNCNACFKQTVMLSCNQDAFSCSI